jgi:hypothetical protein
MTTLDLTESGQLSASSPDLRVVSLDLWLKSFVVV